MSREFLPGQIIAYPYLWAWQQERGETEGRKVRPTCVVIAMRGDQGLTHLVLLAITTQPPQPGRIALDVPEIERKRAGLGDLKRCWIVVDEYNYDVVERSWYIEPGSDALGRFSKAFVVRIANALVAARQSGRRVSRLD